LVLLLVSEFGRAHENDRHHDLKATREQVAGIEKHALIDASAHQKIVRIKAVVLSVLEYQVLVDGMGLSQIISPLSSRVGKVPQGFFWKCFFGQYIETGVRL
jgi:hypothetical protein